MEEKLKSYFEDFSKQRARGEYSPNTIKSYVKNISNLHYMCCGEEPFESLEFLNDKDNIMKSMGDRKASTKRNYINSAIASLQATAYNPTLLKHYESMRDILNNEYLKEKENNKGKTTSQTEIFSQVSKQDIMQLCNQDFHSLKENFDDYQMNMILNLYKAYPFRNELADVKCLKIREFYKVNHTGNKDNYLVIKNSGRKYDLVFNTYKTSKKLGQKVIEITDPKLTKMIMMWLSQVRKIPLKDINYTPFLSWKNGNPLNRNDLSGHLRKYTNKHLGKNISTTLLAKYFSPEIKDTLNPTEEEIKKIVSFADQRGHSLQTHLQHYNQS